MQLTCLVSPPRRQGTPTVRYQGDQTSRCKNCPHGSSAVGRRGGSFTELPAAAQLTGFNRLGGRCAACRLLQCLHCLLPLLVLDSTRQAGPTIGVTSCGHTGRLVKIRGQCDASGYSSQKCLVCLTKGMQNLGRKGPRQRTLSPCACGHRGSRAPHGHPHSTALSTTRPSLGTQATPALGHAPLGR